MIAKLMMAGALVLAAGTGWAETFEVHMQNKGAEGTMVFEPAYVRAAPGDVVKFIPTDKGHNVESIDGMLPDGVDSFKSPFNKEFELTVEDEGLYGIKCTPHYAMGMVALIQVGEAVNLDEAQAVPQRGKAKQRMADLFAQVD